MKRIAAALLALSLVAACGSDGDKKVGARKQTTTTRRSTSTTSTSLGATTTSLGGGTTTTPRAGGTAPGTAGGTTTSPGVTDGVKATKIVQLTRPIAMAVRPGEPGAVYIAQKGGNVRRLQLTGSGATLDNYEVMEIANRISTGGEQGLLGITFSPDGNWLYASYTNTDGDTRVVGYPFANGRANEAVERLILAVDQPYANHNGGQLTFGPDGHLYIALGDGGSGGDPQNHGQNLNSLLGKILRISPRTSGSTTYTVPADNPFVGQSGRRGEIWHYGLRNPWRWSFDRANGEQWIGDVGQIAYEEVNHVGAGARGVNFGWKLREGKHAYEGGERPPGAVDPEIEYSHDNGNCSVTGGYVYRGAQIRGFAGTYVFADHCRGRVMAWNGTTARDLSIAIPQPASFGEDANGEVWVLSLAGGVYRLDRA